jgi:hypothetical protein
MPRSHAKPNIALEPTPGSGSGADASRCGSPRAFGVRVAAQLCKRVGSHVLHGVARQAVGLLLVSPSRQKGGGTDGMRWVEEAML